MMTGVVDFLILRENRPMNPTRLVKIDGLEEARRFARRQSNLSADELLSAKLDDLRIFIRQLGETETGSADLHRRTQLFGDCVPASGDNDRQYYGKLRRWLDRDFKE